MPGLLVCMLQGGMDFCFLWVLCRQVEVSALSWSLNQRSSTQCDVSNKVWSWSLNNGEALAHIGLVCHGTHVIGTKPSRKLTQIILHYKISKFILPTLQHCYTDVPLWCPWAWQLLEDAPVDASFWCNKAAIFSDKGHSINLRSYVTMTNVKEFNKCIGIKEGGVEGERSI